MYYIKTLSERCGLYQFRQTFRNKSLELAVQRYSNGIVTLSCLLQNTYPKPFVSQNWSKSQLHETSDPVRYIFWFKFLLLVHKSLF